MEARDGHGRAGRPRQKKTGCCGPGQAAPRRERERERELEESVSQVAECVSEMQLGTIHFTDRALAAGFERLGAAVKRQKALVARVRSVDAVERELEEARASNERLRKELEELLIELLRTMQAAASLAGDTPPQAAQSRPSA